MHVKISNNFFTRDNPIMLDPPSTICFRNINDMHILIIYHEFMFTITWLWRVNNHVNIFNCCVSLINTNHIYSACRPLAHLLNYYPVISVNPPRKICANPTLIFLKEAGLLFDSMCKASMHYIYNSFKLCISNRVQY